MTSKRIEIRPSLLDLDNTVGLCGRFDLKCDNEFTHKDGSVTPDSCADADCSNVESCGRVKPDDFAESWR